MFSGHKAAQFTRFMEKVAELKSLMVKIIQNQSGNGLRSLKFYLLDQLMEDSGKFESMKMLYASLSARYDVHVSRVYHKLQLLSFSMAEIGKVMDQGLNSAVIAHNLQRQTEAIRKRVTRDILKKEAVSVVKRWKRTTL